MDERTACVLTFPARSCGSPERTQREMLFPLGYRGRHLEGGRELLKEEEGFPGLERRRAFQPEGVA